jgi:hypothetical protein
LPFDKLRVSGVAPSPFVPLPSRERGIGRDEILGGFTLTLCPSPGTSPSPFHSSPIKGEVKKKGRYYRGICFVKMAFI